ncbi:MAG: ABC transporter permease [Anaerolineae bacterium]|nr:ABC transporter permease [Anaerolineae bacterium]
MITHLYTHRRYILKNSSNELRYRYAGTAIGIFWNIINPLLEILIYTVVFSQLFTLRSGSSDPRAYVLFLITGLFPWISFAEAILHGSRSLIKNRVYLRRLALPPDIFIAMNALTSFYSLLLYFVLIILVVSVMGNPLGWSLLLLPLIGLLLHGLAFGITLAIANLQVLIPDVGEVLRAIVHLWRWTMPIIYTIDIFPENIQPLFRLNPPYVFIQSIRQIIIEQTLPSPQDWALMFAWIAVFLLFGAFVSRKLASDVKDEI